MVQIRFGCAILFVHHALTFGFDEICRIWREKRIFLRKTLKFAGNQSDVKNREHLL
jgi:hypothetical protein